MNTKKTSKKAAYTGVFAAVAASSCCIPPVIALIAGIGGSASALSWMEPFRPYLIGIAIIAIGYAWYTYLKPKKAEDCCEADKKPTWYQTKGFLIGITLFAAISIAFPYYASIFYPNNKKEITIVKQSNIETLNFDIKGMTCASCELHVVHAVNELGGIVDVVASFEKANATVAFDNSKTSKKDIEKAINSTGYKVIHQNKEK
ncbi:Mercuric transport protein MerT [Polaribacter huanghezhanensis]|uniref:mercuric transport protein MerTP n=1 Tax=Polaribacter huanghezhanensis TaxID=1354726 RepID=UPI0026482276|nr:mercuric transport protein MerTP [Polaribacter huanghezhanensis]WKD86668.1 Mercuric transport protein MerT [Polaribacter huanghezhanensis]